MAILFGTMALLSTLLVAIQLKGMVFKTLLGLVWLGVITFFYFYVPLILFANKPVVAALKASAFAVRAHFFNTFLLMLLGTVLELLPIYLIIFVGGSITGETSGFGLEQTLVVVLLALILPFTSALILSWYQRVFQQPVKG